MARFRPHAGPWDSHGALIVDWGALITSSPRAMRIVVNGEPRELQEGSTVTELLRALNVREERVAVEVNLDVVRRNDRASRVLVEGDRVEIVSFVGGGR